jgi:diguanylate cyclase (GGDEF)-like protein/PAS domain S-box-containing protein
MFRLFTTKIVWRSAIVVLMVAMLVGTLFGSFTYISALKTEQSNVKMRMQNLVSTVENTVSIACYIRDINLASEVTLGLLKNKDIKSVIIFDSTRTLAVAEKNNQIVSQKKIISNQLAISRDVFSPFNKSEKVCQILLEPDDEYIQSAVNSRARSIVLLILLQDVLLAAVVVYIVLNMISRPIKKISDRLHNLPAETGAQLSLPPGNEKDEIGQLVRDVNKLITRLVSTLNDERQLRIQHQIGEKKFKTIFDNAETGIFLVDMTGAVISSNQAFFTILGASKNGAAENVSDILLERLSGQELRFHLMIDSALRGGQVASEDFLIEVANTGEQRWLNIVISALENGILQGLLNDINDRKTGEEHAKQLAITDHLTGVANRLGLDLEMQTIVSDSQKNPSLSLFMFLIDLDKFKEVNDEYGHDAGDKVLIHFTSILSRTLRKTDFIARVGGDEFVVIVRNLSEVEKAKKIAQSILDKLAQAIIINQERQQVQVGASIGIYFHQGGEFNIENAMRSADDAMYEVKRHGRNAYHMTWQTKA